MRAIPLALLLLAAVALAGCSTPGKIGPQGSGPLPHTAAAPGWAVGDYWRWREPDLVVTGGPYQADDNSTHLVVWTVNRSVTLNGTEAWEVVETGEKAGQPLGEPDAFYKAKATQVLLNGTTGAPEPSRLRFPFHLGETFAMDNGSEVRVAAAPDTTVTPAGSFATYRLEQWSTLPNGTKTLVLRFFYAPAAGNVVRWETHYGGGQYSVRELVGFRLQGGA